MRQSANPDMDEPERSGKRYLTHLVILTTITNLYLNYLLGLKAAGRPPLACQYLFDMRLYYQILTRLDSDKAFIINNIPALIFQSHKFY